MADTVASQTLFDSSKFAIMKFVNLSDGTGESAVTKVDVSALSPSAGEVVIDEIQFSISGMSVRVLWGANTDVECINLNPGQDTLNFEKIGGLTNNAGEGKTGDIKFTTVGASLNDTYSVILKMRKK